MTSNILAKASHRLSSMFRASTTFQRGKNLVLRFGAAFDSFKITWEQKDAPVLGTDKMEGDTSNEELYADGDPFKTALLPDQFGHFSDGIPLTDKSFIAWKNLKPAERAHRNAKRLQESVVRWEALNENPTPTTTRTPNLKLYYFVFMHIPKAGGTTLQHVLSKNYLPNQIIHANAPEILRNPAMLFHMRRKKPRPIIMGHFDRGGLVYEFLNDRPIIHFTMFRDPVKRVVSHFNYLKTRQGHAKHSTVEGLTIEEYATSSIREASNKQTLRILGYSSDEAWYRSMNDPEPLLEEAKKVLEQEFTFFGLTERYTEFLLMAKKLLGWQNIVYQRRNTSSRDSSSQQIIEANPVSEEALQIIRDRNQLDIQLYKFANELFDKRCKAMGIDDTMVEKYDQISQAYQTVLSDLYTV